MRRRNKQDEKKTGITFFSSLFFLAGLGVLVLIGISLGRETYRKRQIQKEIEGLQSEIQKMNQENGDLSNLISYLSTQEFQEKEAREKLNLQKEDEKLIILKKEAESAKARQETQAPGDAAFSDQSTPNWKKWLAHFFSAGG